MGSVKLNRPLASRHLVHGPAPGVRTEYKKSKLGKLLAMITQTRGEQWTS